MCDVECPYCGAEQEINHDDGYGYDEDTKHQQECDNCGKEFIYTTTILFSYEVGKADCLNGGEHKWEPACTFPKEYTRMVCVLCEKDRSPTEVEMQQILSTPQYLKEGGK